MSKRTLSIAASVEYLAGVRYFVRETATMMGADPEAVANLVLATDEVTTNVIVHGYQGRAGTIDIEMERQGNSLLVRVCDQAPPFDSTGVPTPDLALPLEKRPLGGLGVYLARRVVDEMSYRVSAQGRNELTLIKRVESGCS